jgi:hypothetical protein
MNSLPALLALVLCALLPACVSPQGEPDWAAMQREAGLAAADLADVAAVLAAAGEVEWSEGTLEASQGAWALHGALQALSTGAGGQADVRTALGALKVAQATLAALGKAHDEPALAGAAAIAGTIVRRVESYLPPATAPPAG